MGDSSLRAFWIEGPDPRGPLGYGVTAFSVCEALEIVARAGYHLPDDKTALRVRTDIRPADIVDRHVRDHMGPIVVRGLWYPFIGIGVGA